MSGTASYEKKLRRPPDHLSPPCRPAPFQLAAKSNHPAREQAWTGKKIMRREKSCSAVTNRELWSKQLVSVRHVPEILFPYTERFPRFVDHPFHYVSEVAGGY